MSIHQLTIVSGVSTISMFALMVPHKDDKSVRNHHLLENPSLVLDETILLLTDRDYRNMHLSSNLSAGRGVPVSSACFAAFKAVWQSFVGITSTE